MWWSCCSRKCFLLLKLLIKYKFYHLCEKEGNSLLILDIPDLQISGQFLQRSLLHICVSLMTLYTFQIDNKQGMFTSRTHPVKTSHHLAITTQLLFSPRLPLLCMEQLPTPISAHDFHPDTPTCCFCPQPKLSSQNWQVPDRQAWPDTAGLLVLEEGPSGWTKNTLEKLLVEQQSCSTYLSVGTCNLCLLHCDSHIRKPEFGNETEWQGRQTSQEIGNTVKRHRLTARDCRMWCRGLFLKCGVKPVGKDILIWNRFLMIMQRSE